LMLSLGSTVSFTVWAARNRYPWGLTQLLTLSTVKRPGGFTIPRNNVCSKFYKKWQNSARSITSVFIYINFDVGLMLDKIAEGKNGLCIRVCKFPGLNSGYADIWEICSDGITMVLVICLSQFLQTHHTSFLRYFFQSILQNLMLLGSLSLPTLGQLHRWQAWSVIWKNNWE
jgi:hypothetical protein